MPVETHQPFQLPSGQAELTGVHRCIGCLDPVEATEYAENDGACDACSVKIAAMLTV